MAPKKPNFLKKIVDELILNPYLERVKPPWKKASERANNTYSQGGE